MSGDGFQKRREQLLDRLIAGEIDQQTYDRLSAEIERVEHGGRAVVGKPKVPPDPPKSPPIARATATSGKGHTAKTPDGCFAVNPLGGRMSIDISRDGNLIACSDWDGVRLFWPDSGREMTCKGQGAGFETVALDSLGRFAAGAPRSGPRVIHLWRVDTGKRVKSLSVKPGRADKGAVESVAFSLDGKHIVSGESVSGDWGLLEGIREVLDDFVPRSFIRTWDVDSGRQTGRRRTDTALVGFSADGHEVVTFHRDGWVRWRKEDLTKDRTMKFRIPGEQAWVSILSPDFSRAIVEGARHFMLYDVIAEKEIRRFVGHDGYVSAISVSSDWTRAVSGGADGTVRLWDVGTGREIQRFTQHTEPVCVVKFAPENNFCVSASEDGTLRVWDAAQ